MIKLKKLMACAVLSTICMSTLQPLTALADSNVTSPGQASSSAVITADATLLSVTVPTTVLIYKNAAGDVLTPDNMQIVNNSAGPVVVKSLAVQTEGGWTLDAASVDYSKFKVGRKNFSLTFNGKDPAAGALAFETPINGASTLNLVLSAAVAPQKEAINAVKIGSIVVTVDWYADADAGTGDKEPDKGSYPAGYVLATDSDFAGSYDGGFHYIGTADYLVIPDTIDGVPLTSYYNMFAGSAVKGVISNNPNITDMSMMFSYTISDTLDLSGLDTSNVTNMSNMFWGNNATTLDLSSFDTSKVTNMTQMFQDSKATSLILTSFDTSNVTRMVSMFSNSKASTLDLSSFDTSKADMSGMFFLATTTTGYAKTQADTDRLNATDKPEGLTFTVK